MSQRIYNGFGSKENRKRYVCKSDINGKLLDEYCLVNVLTVADLKEIFENINDREKIIFVKTGNSKNPYVPQYTKYIHKRIFYDEVFKLTGLPDFCKIQI